MRTFLVVEPGQGFVVIDDGGVVIRELFESSEWLSVEHASGLLADREMIDTRCELKPEDREAYYAARVAHVLMDTGMIKLQQKLNVPEENL